MLEVFVGGELNPSVWNYARHRGGVAAVQREESIRLVGVPDKLQCRFERISARSRNYNYYNMIERTILK